MQSIYEGVLAKQAVSPDDHNKRREMARFKFLRSGRLAAGATTEKQKNFAIMIAADFVDYDHNMHHFSIADLEMFLDSSLAQSHLFWLNCKPWRLGSGATEQRAAVEKAITAMKKEQSADLKANQAIAQLTPAQLSKKIGRGL